MKENLGTLSLGEGASAALPDGTRIVIESLDEPAEEGAYGDTEEHEAEHAVVAIANGTPVIEASVIPEGNSLGHVKLGHYDPIAFATSHGRRGNGHDAAVVRMIGHNFDTHGAVAKSIKARNRREIRAVASALAREKHLSGARVREIMARAGQGGHIRVRIIGPGGKEKVVARKFSAGKRPDLREIVAADLPREPVQQPAHRERSWKHVNDNAIVASRALSSVG